MRRSTAAAIRSGLPVLAAMSALCAAGAAPACAETWVSYPTLLEQVRSGSLIRAIINPTRSDVEIEFRNLSEWHAYYPHGAQPALERELHARHVRVIFVPRPHRSTPRHATVHHHLRYVAAAVIGVLALIAACLLAYSRRRSHPRPRSGESAGP